MTPDSTKRQYEFDWLRIFATLVVFLYHSTRFFNLGDWHIKNETTYVEIEIWWMFVTRWMMPLFFVISGASLYFAIGKPGGIKRFYTDKFRRLMIPVLFGSITHGSFIVYIEHLNHGRFSGSFFAFIRKYFHGMYSGYGDTSGNFNFFGGHLWYLLFLFFYGLVCYRIFIWFKTGGGKILERICTVFATPGLIYIWFAIPLLLIEAVIPRNILDSGTASWGFVFHVWFLIAGFIIVSSKKLQQVIKSQVWVSLVLGIILSTLHINFHFGGQIELFEKLNHPWLVTIISLLTPWCWILAFLGFGAKFLNFNRPVLSSLNEGVLPFFILHQTVLIVLGYFIMAWRINDGMKWLVVFSGSFIVIITLYLGLIRRFDPTRFLFGMKTTRSIYHIFDRGVVLSVLLVLWVGLAVFAASNHKLDSDWRKLALPLRWDKKTDILFNADTITLKSESGVRIVTDQDASIGRALEFFEGALPEVKAMPEVYIDLQFKAPAGRFYFWIRGKCIEEGEYSDSIWTQVDEEIGTDKGSPHLGNWNSFQPVGEYSWAGNVFVRYPIVLRFSGYHRIRIQPRQIPHRIDQIWISKGQDREPNTNLPIDTEL